MADSNTDTGARIQPLLKITGETWVLSVAFDGKALSFEMTEKDDPENAGGWVTGVNPEEFVAGIRKITAGRD